MKRRPYATDLSDAEYACLAPHLPPPMPTGRPRLRPLREILDGIFYVARTGCQWRLLPYEFPPWQTVYHSLAADAFFDDWLYAQYGTNVYSW